MLLAAREWHLAVIASVLQYNSRTLWMDLLELSITWVHSIKRCGLVVIKSFAVDVETYTTLSCVHLPAHLSNVLIMTVKSAVMINVSYSYAS